MTPQGGGGRIGRSDGPGRHITLVKPGAPAAPPSLFTEERLLGMEAADGSVTPGEEPAALGAETFAMGQ